MAPELYSVQVCMIYIIHNWVDTDSSCSQLECLTRWEWAMKLYPPPDNEIINALQ
jgi:hypothetical protein